jgi:carbamoyl-phosphate synthase small subunit
MADTRPAVLLLEDGTIFRGLSCGKIGTTSGEIAFNTGMTGYQEVFTDPSYFGQILIMNTAHIGNYGVHHDEKESDRVMIAGLVTKKFSNGYSRPAAFGPLQEYLDLNNTVGISDIDTRALVRHIREVGAMNAIISSEILDADALKEILVNVPSMNGLELSSKVSTEVVVNYGDPLADLRVALVDFGVKRNIIRCLLERGCFISVFPMDVELEELKAMNPSGIMLSNGPGDPAAMLNQIEMVKSLVDLNLPIFGICLGHQIFALSQGLKTEKMHHGHRGLNHPVKNVLTGKCEVTSQNHGFVVSHESLYNNLDIELTHIHLNDNSVAGIQLKNKPIFTVQYHPESSAGPHDSRYLFDQFIVNMKNIIA